VAYFMGWLCEKAYKYLNLKGEPPMTPFVARELATSHWFDISAAKKDLGYRPLISIEDGLKELANWLSKSQNNYRDSGMD